MQGKGKAPMAEEIRPRTCGGGYIPPRKPHIAGASHFWGNWLPGCYLGWWVVRPLTRMSTVSIEATPEEREPTLGRIRGVIRIEALRCDETEDRRSWHGTLIDRYHLYMTLYM